LPLLPEISFPHDHDCDYLITSLSIQSFENYDTTMAETISRLQQEAEEAKHVQQPTRVKDITQEFVDACNQLPPGELVKDEWFTLFESVGALEVMEVLPVSLATY
jgi:hypothetical protein